MRLRAEQFFAFAWAIQEAVDDPAFPLRIVEGLSAETFAAPVFAALCSPNLTVALERLARFKPLVAPVQLEIADTPSGLDVCYRWLETAISPPMFLLISESLFLVKLARMGTRHEVRPTRVTLPSLPQGRDAYEDFLGCRLHQGDRVEVRFRSRDATRPFLTANSSMWSLFEPQLRQRLVDLASGATFEARTRAALFEALPSGQVSVSAVARRLAVSSRTLQRRLRTEGTTYNAVVQDTRLRLARHYLRRTELSSSEIAYLLGFGEPNSFFRAFRQWTGTTPQSLR